MRQMRLAVLLYLSRFFGICAIIAGLGAGVFLAGSSGLTCFDSCPTPAQYLSGILPGTVVLTLPCFVLALLALATSAIYCIVNRQSKYIVAQSFVFLIGGLVEVGIYYILFLIWQSKLPVNTDGLVVPEAARQWGERWGVVIAILTGVWAGILAYIQWSPNDRRLASLVPPPAE